MIKYPDYDNSILSVISSILKYYGYDTGHVTQKYLDEKLKKRYRNIVLMLFDGMGVSTIKKHLTPKSFLMEHFIEPISSVCPSTTGCAIPTYESGLAPIEHAWLGWDMYFKEYDANITVFKNTFQGSNEKVPDCNAAQKYMPYKHIFDIINEVTHGEVTAHDISKYSDTNEFVYSCEEMSLKVQDIAKNKVQDFVYTYLEEPDSVMHALGVDHEYVKENVRYINSLVRELCEQLEDSLVIVSADHGLLNTEAIYLSNYPKLVDMLVRRTSIETRAVNFYVKEEYKEAFKDEFNKHFSKYFILMTKEEILEKGLFGPGKQNARIDEVVGDYMAFAISNKALEWEDDGFKMEARHAGLTQEEMEVPLIVIDTNDINK